MSQTAIVILNYNGEQLLQQFLPIVVQHSEQARIIVADNASTDRSVAMVRQNFPSVEIIELDANYGYSEGYNRALGKVVADYYVLLNSDVEVTAGWLTPMTALLDQHEAISAIQPKIRSYKQRTKFEHAGAAGGFIDSLGYPFCRGRMFDHVEEDNGQYNDTRETFWASGACMVIRSASFHQFGGFDKDYFAHMEEIDLCWKLHRDEQKVYYCGESTVFHIGAGTLTYGHPRKIMLNFRNGLFMIFKHFAITELLYKFPLRLFLDWVACVMFILQGKWRNGASILQAHLLFVGNLGREIKKRRLLHRAYPRYSRAGIKRGSIVFDFYVQGKKRFS